MSIKRTNTSTKSDDSAAETRRFRHMKRKNTDPDRHIDEGFLGICCKRGAKWMKGREKMEKAKMDLKLLLQKDRNVGKSRQMRGRVGKCDVFFICVSQQNRNFS